jgi:glycosyltransferase involved in cell wall biosynthesis
VDIICSVLDGERFLPDLLESLRWQSTTAWRLWFRDDGSVDGTVEVLRAAARADERIHILHVGGPRLGVAGGFGWLLERIPSDAQYIMCADADDIWLSTKIERTLDAMHAAERGSGAALPVLVHTDLVVVDDTLQVLHPSLWAMSGVARGPVTLRRLAVQNVVTAPTVMLNRALRDLIGSTPPAARFQDWWYAMTAAAFGRVVAVTEPTILYRQHGANAVGAKEPPATGFRQLGLKIAKRLPTSPEFRRDLWQTAAQARAFLQRYDDRLSDADRRFLYALSRLPEQGLLRRKLDLLRYRVLPETGLLATLGVLWRG